MDFLHFYHPFLNTLVSQYWKGQGVESCRKACDWGYCAISKIFIETISATKDIWKTYFLSWNTPRKLSSKKR